MEFFLFYLMLLSKNSGNHFDTSKRKTSFSKGFPPFVCTESLKCNTKINVEVQLVYNYGSH